MKLLLSFVCGALCSNAALVSDCERGFSAGVPSGSNLRLDLKSGDIEVIGTTDEQLRVTCSAKKPDDNARTSILYTSADDGGTLRVKGGPSNGFRIRVEVPRNSHLRIRAAAGDMMVRGIEGHQDVAMKAGDLEIWVGDPAQYARTSASVRVGGLEAEAFGVNKGGFFRSFKRENSAGRYQLRAKLGAGDLSLR